MTQLMMDMEIGEEIGNSGSDDDKSENMTLEERIKEERIVKSPSNPFNVRQLSKMKIRFDLAIQRNLRWVDTQKTKLIESCFLGYPIPPVYALRTPDKELWLLDGKQRLSTLISFIRDEWELTECAVYGVDVTGMKFSQLPEELREIVSIETYINVIQFDSLTVDQRDSLFERLNSGTPLLNVELTRAILGTDMLEYVNGLLEGDFFKLVNMSEAQVDKFVHQELTLQTIGIITGELKDLSGNSVREFAQKLRDKGLPDEQRQTIRQVFLYLSNAFRGFDDKQLKKALKKNDAIAIVGSVLDTQIDPDTFGGKVMAFLLKPSQAYKDTKRSGSAKESNITKRIDILKSILNG